MNDIPARAYAAVEEARSPKKSAEYIFPGGEL
jgi:hypothetical protein